MTFVLFGVILVFAVFAALAHFVFHSPEAVKALGMAALGSLGGVIPGVINRHEFRLTQAGLDKRVFKENDPPDFQKVFAWGELDHVVRTRHGFKFYKPITDKRAIDRWWKKWFSSGYSGEFQVGNRDRPEVTEALRAKDLLPS
jgi:hypothetical protein